MHSSKTYKKIIVFTSRFPFPLEKGDKLRAYHQIKELSEHFEVYLISLSEHSIPDSSLEELQRFCKAVHVHHLSKFRKWSGALLQFFGKKPIQVGYFHSWSIQRKVKEELNRIKPEHIYCQLIRSSEYVKNYHDCDKTIDYMDALSKGIERRAESAGKLTKWIFRMEHKRLMRYENSIFEYFENHTIISEQDRKYIFHKNKDRIAVVPNGVDSSYYKKMPVPVKADILFTGNMSYPPNITASKYIVNEILPLLPKDTQVMIAGANPSREVNSLGAANVEITGWVDDIRKSYSAAKIFVAPMFLGTGLQNKLLEAMATGIPCITTTLANNALKALPDEEILIANDVNAFVEKITLLQTNEELYEKLSVNGKEFIRSNYDWKPVTQKLVDLISV